MKKLALVGALALAIGLSGCDMSGFNANLVQTTKNVVDLNNALVQVNKTIIDNLLAQAKLLAPYQCGAYALGSAILNDSSAAGKVNAYLKKNVAANVSNVAVRDICAAVGYPTTVTSAPAAPASGS
ncbi:MAG TPA: hypothetical protein VEF90_17850 [Xanthobacteraceae bacterium]|nr:hypothetical protein [Xanthobacteraceae bacterium]